MKKRILCTLLCAGLLSAYLTGCGKSVDAIGDSSQGKDSAIDASAQTVDVTTEVNVAYTAQKLGLLAGGSEEYTFKFPDNDTEKKFTKLGKDSLSLIVLDGEGRENTWILNINTLDTVSPVFEGIKDIKAKAGKAADLKKGVTAKDNYDGKSDFKVVFASEDEDPDAPGKHTITYVATDSSGNVSSRKATLTLTGKAPDKKESSKTVTTASKEETQTQTTTITTEATTKEQPANGVSQNVKFYQDRVVIAGDSVAYGFCSYGYIPYEHNIAKGSTALRHYDDTSLFMFDPTGTPLSFMDAIAAVKPSLLYISMGMNDVNIIDADKYVERYKDLISKVKQRVPDCIIVTAAITPITQASTFTKIENIRTFNEKLKATVEELNNPDVVFFDAYNAIVGPDGYYIPNEYSPKDGVHVAGSCYQTLLEKLALTLDSYGMKERIEQIEAAR